MKKLLEEKEYLDKIRLELEEENRIKQLKKQNLMYDYQQEFNKYINKKKLEEEKIYNDKIESQNSLSLPLQHEERMENYKNMMNKLSDKIEYNVNQYKKITNNHPDNHKFSYNFDSNKEKFDFNKMKNESHPYQDMDDENKKSDKFFTPNIIKKKFYVKKTIIFT